MINGMITPSSAVNSYELFEEVIVLIQEEVNRIVMEVPVIVNARYMDSGVEFQGGGSDIRLPACNTQGCIGGWIGIKRGLYNQWFKSKNGHDYPTLVQVALSFFPPLIYQELYSGLFHGCHYLGGPADLEYPFPPMRFQQEEYAQAVIRNIQKFMAKHEQVLKEFILPPMIEEPTSAKLD